MKTNHNLSGFRSSSPLRQLFLAILIVIAGGALIFSLFLLAGSFIFSGNMSQLINPVPENGLLNPGFIKFLLIVQDISFFIVPALFIIGMQDEGYRSGILNIRSLSLTELLLVVILAFCAFPVTSVAGQLNSGMLLPDWLSGTEQWMKDKEEYADKLMEAIMIPETFRGMWINIFVVALLPAIGEELIFRGVFQTIFLKLFKSGHIAVWITAVIFSAIHLQFYGFIPRLILGLIFGYLFLWSRNIWLPVIAHFINNAVPTYGAYIKGWDAINDPSLPVDAKQIIGVLLPMAACLVILAWFRKRSAENHPADPEQPSPGLM